MRSPSFCSTVIGLALLAGVTACSDATIASPVAETAAPIVYVPFGMSADGDTASATFTVNPYASETYIFPGGSRVQIVANSVCDPAVTAYGPQHWDRPCTTITRPITFRVTSWVNDAGRARIRILPDVRFAPDKINTLWLNDASAAWGGGFIGWCPTGTTGCMNEALSDASASTSTDPANGMLRRRVKHFSGYTVIAD